MADDDTTTPFPLLDETLHATSRYLGALTVLDETALASPSALPGWTRAHVIAHLSRNADAFTRVLELAAAGEPASMYVSAEARDHDIDQAVVTRDAAALVEDANASSLRLAEALTSYKGPSAATYGRLPDLTEEFALDTLVPRRLTEVEVHHVDLMLDYAPTDWPPAFSCDLVNQRVDELVLDGPSMVLSSTDVEGMWRLGSGSGPEIRGPSGALAWWLLGRGGGAGLSCSGGDLPTIPRWR